jgi:hypothetical protein
MGWKVSMLIINKPAQVDNQQLLQDLGFEKLTRIEDRALDEVFNPDNGEVYIGTYKDNLIICAPDLPYEFLEDQDTPAGQVLARTFPSSEICSVVLHSVVNLWGYAVSKGGKQLRARAGSAEDGTFIEKGEVLEEEKELLGKSTVDKNGKRTYVLRETDADDPYTEDQVGENFVFALCKRYFGHELDYSSDDRDNTRLAGYSYQKTTGRRATMTTKREGGKWKRWALYALIFILIAAWKIYRRVNMD